MMELLAPAGGMGQLRAARRFGADAVYGGLRRFGLRASAANFGWEELAEALRLTHDAGKRFYLTLNILPHDEELEDLVRDAARAREMGADAAIVSDLGAFALLRQRVPELPEQFQEHLKIVIGIIGFDCFDLVLIILVDLSDNLLHSHIAFAIALA